MASFLDRFANSVNNFGNKVVEKTSNSTENIRLSSAIKDEERIINETYIAIGKKYRELYGEAPAPEFVELLGEIYKHEAVVADHRLKIQQNKGKTNCQNCGAEIDATAQFCNLCGTKNPMADEIARAKAEAAAKAQAEAAAKAQAEAEARAKAQAANMAFQQNFGNAPSPAPVSEPAAGPAVAGVCKNCGANVIVGNAFCTNCGTRFEG